MERQQLLRLAVAVGQPLSRPGPILIAFDGALIPERPDQQVKLPWRLLRSARRPQLVGQRLDLARPWTRPQEKQLEPSSYQP